MIIKRPGSVPVEQTLLITTNPSTMPIKKLVFLSLLAFASASEDECLKSLMPIAEAEEEVVDEQIQRTYILCPNTEFKISDKVSRDLNPDESHTLFIRRSNVHILCGKSAESSNNCAITGGYIQIKFADFSEREEPVTNVLLQGITFKEAINHNILVTDQNGYLIIRDCIFQDNHNMAPIKAHLSRNLPLNRNRKLRQVSGVEDATRDLGNAAVGFSLDISESSFVNNTLWHYSGQSIEGLLTISGAKLSIWNTNFVGTKLESDELQLAYLICSIGGKLVIHDNCFIGNDYRIAPVVTENSGLEHNSNFIDRKAQEMSATSCEFVASIVSGSIEDTTKFDEVSFSCADSDAPTCTSASLGKIPIPCLQSLDEIYRAEQKIGEAPEFTRTYILCPGTSYHIEPNGAPIDADVTHTGSYPIVLARPNIRILCGADGSSANACVVREGQVQLIVFNEFATESSGVSNAIVKGVTFTGASSVNVLVAYSSEVLFEDCIFKENKNLASIYIEEGKEKETLGVIGASHTSSVGGESIEVTVSQCAFFNNTIGSIPRQSEGLITSKGGVLHVARNTFLGTIDAGDSSDMTYVIGIKHGVVHLTDNCFDDNEVSMATVMLGEGGEATAGENYGKARHRTEGGCEFLLQVKQSPSYVFDTLDADEIQTSCTRFTGPSCSDHQIAPIHHTSPTQGNKEETIRNNPEYADELGARSGGGTVLDTIEPERTTPQLEPDVKNNVNPVTSKERGVGMEGIAIALIICAVFGAAVFASHKRRKASISVENIPSPVAKYGSRNIQDQGSTENVVSGGHMA